MFDCVEIRCKITTLLQNVQEKEEIDKNLGGDLVDYQLFMHTN